MSFDDVIQEINLTEVRERIQSATGRDVERALSAEQPGLEHAPALFSEAAVPFLEEIARRSAALTRQRFGRVIYLFIPLYISNECVNNCPYCGFAKGLDVKRITLTPNKVMREAVFLHSQGFRHLLLVSGEHPAHVSIDYLRKIIASLDTLFDSISIEIQPMTREEYLILSEAGVDGLTLYQETYDPELYKFYHRSGPKSRYDMRLMAIESGGEAELRTLGIGALLGLGDWRFEAVMLAHHGRYLMRRFWRSRLAVSFPRIRTQSGGFQPKFSVTDRDLIQMICGMRLLFPDAELVISTREAPSLRDNLIGLGITRMSAGSRTIPGGYLIRAESNGGQFEVEDRRTPEEVCHAICAKGFEPVWKDFDRQFCVKDT